MENKGSRGEGEADLRARLPRARPGLAPASSRGAGRAAAGLERSLRAPCAGRGPRLPRGPKEPSLRAPAAMLLHSRRAPVI